MTTSDTVQNKMWAIYVILLFSFAEGFERWMNFTKNPRCDAYNLSLYYVKALGPKDTFHYLWDFSRRPTIFFALSEANVDININCTYFFDRSANSFSFTSEPTYEFTLIIKKLIEFNDVNNTGILTPDTPTVFYDTKDFSWTVTDEAKVNDNHQSISLKMTGSNYKNQQNTLSGNFTVQLMAFGFEDHDSELPRLLHSPNSTQCKLYLENLVSNSSFNKSRFAVEFILVSRDNRNSSSKIKTRKNLDDENSPGIFSIVDIITPKSQEQRFRGAYIEWRPIFYTSKVPSIANSSETVVYNLTTVDNPQEVLNYSLPYMYYGRNLNSLLTEQTIVSMGMTDDGFYGSTNFSSWTFLVDYGSPSEEKLSLLVILIMSIGLGLPMLLIVTGGTYMCARRMRRSKDELSLER